MWPLTSEIRIRMGQLRRGFAILLVLFATKLDAASSSSSLSLGSASSVLPSVSSSTLSTRIQSVTSSTNGGFSTAPSSKYAINATLLAHLASDSTPSLSSGSSITKTETSTLSVSGTRMFNSQSTTVPLNSSQHVGASQSSRNVVLSTVSLKYSINTSAVSSSSLNLKSSSVQQVQTSEISPSLQRGNTSASMPYLTSVVSSAVNLSNVVSAMRTLLLTHSSSAIIGQSIFSQSQLSHTLTVNGSSTELHSSSIAGSLSSQKANSLMVSSSSVTMAINRTLATSPLTSSMLTNVSKVATETFSTHGMSLTSLASTTSKSSAESKLLIASDSAALKSVTMSDTPVLMNSSAQSVNATVMSTTVPTIKTRIIASPTDDSTRLSTSQSSSSVVNLTHPFSPFASSTGLVSQTRAVADSSAVLPSDTPSLNETVSAVKTSGSLPSATASSQPSVGVGVESSITTVVGESVMASQNTTSQSILATVSSAGVLSSIATASGEESTPVSSPVAVSSSELVSPVASSSTVTEGIISPTPTSMGNSPSSAPSVAPSRLVFSRPSQSSLTGRFTLTSQAATSSRSSVETVTSAVASVTSNKTSTDEGFIVTSYSTPCYIYYVVEKTVFPVATANHSAALSTSTTPKITLDIASASRMQSGLPSVTLTHTIASTTQASETQSQVIGSSVALTSSTGVVGVSADSSMITPSSTLKRMSSKVSVLSSEAVTKAMVTATSKVVSTFQTGVLSTRVQSTPSLSGTLAIPRVTSSVLELQSKSLTSKASTSSTMTLSGSFTPIVATASVSEMQNVTSTLITATSLSIIQATTKHQSLQSSPRSSFVMSRSSAESTVFVPTVAKSLPSQSGSSTRAVSSVSLVISSNSRPVTTQSPAGSLLPTIIQTSASSMTPTITFSGTSKESHVASSPSQFTNVLESSNVLMVNSTRMSLVSSATMSENVLSLASNQTSTNIISSPSVLRSSLATVNQDRNFTTVSTQLSSGATDTSKASSSVRSVVQSSTMALEDSSASGVEMLSSSNIHTLTSANAVIVTPSTEVSREGVLSTQVVSSHEAVSSSSPSIADNKTSSVVAVVSMPISTNTQVAVLSSNSQSDNKMSASSAKSFSSSGIHMPFSVSTSVQEPHSSVVLPLSVTPQTSVIGVPASSSIHVALSSSFSRADSKSSLVEHQTSSPFPMEASSSLPGKKRRKKRDVGDTTSTTLVANSSSRSVLTSLSTGTVTSASQGSSALIAPSSSMVTQTLQVSTSVLQSIGRGSTYGLVPTSVLSSSGPLESVSGSPSSRSVSASFSSSKKTTSSMPQGISSSTVVLPSGSVSTSSASGPVLTVNTTGVSSAFVKVTGSATSSFRSLRSQQANVTRSHTGSVIQSPSSATLHVGLTPSGTLTQSDSVLVSSSGKESSSLQASEAVKSTTAHANLSVTNVVDTLTPSPTTVELSAKVTSTPLLSLGIVTSSVVLGNSTSTLAQSVVSESSRVQSFSVGVVISSIIVENGTLPSASSSDLEPSVSAVLGNSTSTLPHAVTSMPSSVKSPSSDVVVSSTFVDNRTLPSTSSQHSMLSSAILSDSASSLAQSTTSMNQASTLIGSPSVTASTSSALPDMISSFVVVFPSPSSVSSSFIQPPGESSITVLSSSPQQTNIRSVTSSSTVSSPPLISMSVASTSLHGPSEIASSPSPSSSAPLSSPTTDQSSQAVSSSVLTRPSSSAAQSSEVKQTVVSSSVQISSSSRVYRPPLVTISSLGICYVVYTTRIVQPSLVSTPPVNMSSTASVIRSSTVSVNVSSTASVNVSSTRVLSVATQSLNTTVIQVSPSESLNTSSRVVQPTLEVNATRSQFSQVLSTSLQVTVTVKPSGSSSSVIISSTTPVVNSTTSLPVMASSMLLVRSSQSLSVQKSVSSIAVSAIPSVKETSLSTSAHLPSTQVPTSQLISPTPTVSKEVSSSVTVPPTQPPDPSLLIEAIFKVPADTDIQSEEFITDLEKRLADAYRFAELSRRRRKRETPEINATIASIQRVNNEGDVNVTYFITKDGQRLPASEAAQNYQKLSKAQLGSFVNLEVVSSPEPLVVPTTPPLPAYVLASLLIQDSVSNNVSDAANKKKLEDNLAAYYKEQKQLTATVTASIKTILHEPNEIVYLEFYISVSDQAVNASDVVETFKVPNVNLLTAKLGFQVLVQVYIPDSLTASEADYVIIGISVPENQDLTNAAFRSDLADKLVKLYQKAKGQTNSRRKKRSGSTIVTIKDIVKKASSNLSEADVTFFVYEAGKVANASYVVSIMNRLSTGDMTTVTSPYAVLSAPRQAFLPTAPTELTPTVAATPIKYWIIAAVIGPIMLVIIIILLICWRWKKGAPKSKVEPDTIRMLETNKRKPVQGFDVARYSEEGVSGVKTTAFMSSFHPAVDNDVEAPAIPVKRETSLRRKVQKRPIQKPPVREQRQENPAYHEEEEEEGEEDESVASVTPPRSTEALTRERIAAKPPPAPRMTFAKAQRPAEPSELGSEEDSELSEGESESEPESVPQPEQTRHSAAQVPTVAVMSEASGPPRYPPVRFRSSVHPAPTLPPLNAKHTSLVGVKVEPPSEDDSTRGRRKGKSTKRELEHRADLERQKNKQRLRDRKRNASRSPDRAVPAERKAWNRAQYDFDDVLEDDDAERVITGRKRKPRRRRPPSSSVATDEERVPHLKSYRKLKSPKTTSSISTRDHDKKRDKSESVSNASSDESEIDMNETRRRMHLMLDDAFSLFGTQFSKKFGKEPEGQPASHPEAHPRAHPEVHPVAHPEGYPSTPARQAVIPRYLGGQPALPEPPPAHGRATEPTPRQRRRVQPTMPGYPVGMPQTPLGMPGYPGRPPVRPIVTRDPIVVWDPADRQRILNQRAPPPTYSYKDPSGQNVYITSVQQQRDDMGGLVWSPYAAEDTMDTLYPDLAQASYPGALGTSPPKDTSFLSHLQAAPPHDTVLNMSASGTLDQRGASLGQSPQPLIKSIKDELFRLSQGASRKTPITEL